MIFNITTHSEVKMRVNLNAYSTTPSARSTLLCANFFFAALFFRHSFLVIFCSLFERAFVVGSTE